MAQQKHFLRIASGLIITLLVFGGLAPVGAYSGPSAAAEQTKTTVAFADASWLSTDWQYRRAVTVTNSSTQTVAGQQVGVTLNSANFTFSHSSGKDIRFTDSDGTTLLNHWTESYNATTQTASLYVLMPEMPASAMKTIYLYYGNASATEASSGSKTLNFYDGFERLRNASAPLTTPTYDGSGQTVHPDVVHFPNGWNGYKYWMAITPYPGGNDKYENPSILASNNGTSWSVPAGATNPLVATPPCDHNSDPDMLYNDATGELWMYYLDTRRASHCAGHQGQSYYNRNYMKLIKSSDGVHWSSPVTVINWNLSSEPLYVSPSVVKVGASFYLWAVNSSTFAIRTSQSSDGVNFGSSQAATGLSQAWHTDVEYIPSKNEYWMFSNYPSIPHGVLRFARSKDRVNWTSYTAPALSYSTGWDQGLYRSTFLYDPQTNTIRLWYSANNNGSPIVWRTGYATVDYNDLLNGLSARGGWTLEQGSGMWSTSTAQKKRGTLSAQLVQSAGTSMALRKTLPLANNFYMEADVYDDLDSTAFKIPRITNGSDQRLGLGVWTGASASKYVYHNKSYAYTVTSVTRTKGWHKFGMLLRADSSVTYFIDGQNVGTIAGQFANATQLQIEGYSGGTTSYFVDDIRVRKWAGFEPAVLVGPEEAV